ncbi:hypothetical protein [Terasakiella pusilla]|uniref:hypothetical protein n=1 Tax=Terasakiella pusilla TaxID=64973 RepID=UPI003AA9D5E8
MKNDERFHMRVSPEFIKILDDWRRTQPDIPSRAESIRRLVMQGHAFDVDLIADFLKILPEVLDRDKIDKEAAQTLISFTSNAVKALQLMLQNSAGSVDISELGDVGDIVSRLDVSPEERNRS